MRIMTFFLLSLTACSGKDVEDDDEEVGLIKPDIDTEDPPEDTDTEAPPDAEDSGDTPPPDDTSEPVDSGQIAISDSELKFSAAGDAVFTISNVGTGGLSISDISLNGEGEAAFTAGEPGAYALAPDSSTTVTVTFTPPEQSGGWRAEIQVTSDDLDDEVVSIALLGGVGQAQLGFGAEPLEIDDAVIGCAHSGTAVLRNTGGGFVEISALSISGASELTLGEKDALPVSLLSGEHMDVEVVYQPLDEDDDVAYLLVATDDAPGTLTIEGAADPYDEGAEFYELTAPTATFTLSDAPVETTIEVRVDGSDQAGHFSYDSKSQAVVMSADSIAPAGAVVEIEYAIAGGC